ncbi:hypothetical protein DFR58_12467 [Anaerobacterium chartisolvens]|uniref:Uncharacterized protein n=1 Tax=Anaerobacterium chartisolvens TaxID=1297424 RepID=A0A369AV75_9FIRM|nr:hypothetical protein [Anaerobacterium chartisolvens]RCX12117.1 hypothetical protein DFR58_12467 [Anaerobacterium chartisolvens]
MEIWLIAAKEPERLHYKHITASENLLLWTSHIQLSLSSYKFLSTDIFFRTIGFNIEDRFYQNIAFDVAGFHVTKIETYATILHKKNIPVQTIENIVKSIISILNTEIFWIRTFDLIIQINKSSPTKLTMQDFKIISTAIENIEFDSDNVRLKYEYLSSMDKKALRILEDKNTPVHKTELFQELTMRENGDKTLYQIDSLVNVLSINPHVRSIGKTGMWILSKYEFDSRHQADIIQWAFHENNSSCQAMTANEIYSKVCLSRDDLRIEIIYSYLYTLRDRFLPVGNGKFILASWRKKYQKEINAFEKKKFNRTRFDLIVRSNLSDGKSKTLKEIFESLQSENIALSEGRISVLLQNDYVESFKVKNKNYYRLKVSSDDNRLAFLKVLKEIVLEIKNGIENRKAFTAFYNHDEPKSESHVQVEIYERMRGYLKAVGIDPSREVYTGLGPVDFKFSMGYNLRVFMELKLASNANVLEGLTAQLPQYMGSEGVKLAIFTVVILSDDDFCMVPVIEQSIKDLETKYTMHIEYVVIDARV